MSASLFNFFSEWRHLLTNPVFLVMCIFQIWMFVHAVRSGEWLWAAFIVIGSGLSALLYYFFIYRTSADAMSGFELPGAHKRKRIKELQTQIHNLDKAHHYSQLGDIYFQQGKLEKAEANYRAALEREPNDIDTRAHYGQCLLRLKRPAEARPLLEGVVTENPGHEYSYTMMALAETVAALGETDNAILYWQHILKEHFYPRAKVQLAELYIAKKQFDLARVELKDVLSDVAHAPAFQRRRDRVWFRRARQLIRTMPAK